MDMVKTLLNLQTNNYNIVITVIIELQIYFFSYCCSVTCSIVCLYPQILTVNVYYQDYSVCEV